MFYDYEHGHSYMVTPPAARRLATPTVPFASVLQIDPPQSPCDQESVLNTSAPQFRTALPCPGLPAPGRLRLHFIHVRSASPSAVPLLLLPPFPLTAHALTHLIAPLTYGWRMDRS